MHYIHGSHMSTFNKHVAMAFDAIQQDGRCLICGKEEVEAAPLEAAVVAAVAVGIAVGDDLASENYCMADPVVAALYVAVRFASVDPAPGPAFDLGLEEVHIGRPAAPAETAYL